MGLGAAEIVIILSIVCCFSVAGIAIVGGIVYAIARSQGKGGQESSDD